jgi:transcriptional regulator with XRE-family HTH domain
MIDGNAVRAARKAAHLSQVDLAKAVGMAQQTIAAIEQGRTKWTKFLPQIARALNKRLSELDPDWGAFDEQCSTVLPASRDEATSRARLDADYAFFAGEILRIRTKSGAIAPLVFNRAQQHIHAALEAQRADLGRVRALILKGRQQGCSTYIGGRYYHRTGRNRGLRAFILTHEHRATQNLFEMVERFHANCPNAEKPLTGAANAEELTFDALDSGFKVGTAGTKGVGRSATIQLFHGSEVAFWPFAETHAAGVLQAVPNQPGTEIILESTANGVGNFFHKKWREAETGRSEYLAIFVPWHWQDEYRLPAGKAFKLDPEESEYAGLYGLDPGQMVWRRGKIDELGDPLLFKQEYPATAAEAFQMSGHDSYLAPILIARARKARHVAAGPLVIGFDPAWKGGDRHSMAWRQGRCVTKIVSRRSLDTMEAAGWAKQVIDAEKPKKFFVDVGGVGAGVYDRLQEWGEPYASIVTAVNFGSAPREPPPLDEHGRPSGGPLNRRAEMWMKSREWLEDPAGAQIPDSDSLQADACGPCYTYDSNTRLVLESKDNMRRRGFSSPDEWDAVALTFAEPLAPSVANFHRKLEYGNAGTIV